MHLAGTDSMRHFATTLLMILTLATASPSLAVQLGQAPVRPAIDNADPEYSTHQRGITLQQAVAQVRRQYPGGKIVSAETQGDTHVIKVLTAEGTVRTVRIPAR